MRLRVVMPVPDHRVAVASRATDALWPAVLAHQGEALRVVEQGGEVDRVHCDHDDRNPPCSPATTDRLEPSSYPNSPPRASITPEADKSLRRLLEGCFHRYLRTSISTMSSISGPPAGDGGRPPAP